MQDFDQQMGFRPSMGEGEAMPTHIRSETGLDYIAQAKEAMKTKLEICCGSYDDVYYSARGGADRAELNSALSLGGLTPSLGTVRKAKTVGIPLMVMVRPRAGGFCYTEGEFETMLADINAFAEEGVDGLVFGVLLPDGRVDKERCKLLVEAAGAREKVFHRAFDVVPDWRKAMDELIELGFDRILTSGQAPNSISGADTLKEMIEYSAGRIEILPGGGIRPHNVKELIEICSCNQIHASAGGIYKDTSCSANKNVHFGTADDKTGEEFTVTEPEKVIALRNNC